MTSKVSIKYTTTTLGITYMKQDIGILNSIIIVSGIACGIYIVMDIINSVTINVLRSIKLED